MMQITHEEAHTLIQFNVDGGLGIEQQHLLTSHLAGCMECQRYAASIRKVESLLGPLLHRQWDGEPLPLSLSALTVKGTSLSDRIVVATRIAAFAVVFVTFFFGAWNFTVSSRRTPTPFLHSVPMIPTPFTSTMTAGTASGVETCAMSSYVVEQNDTLASIAKRFSVSADAISQANPTRPEGVWTGETLIIPICNFTPTNPAVAYTTTFTPALVSTTTPDG